MLAIQTAAETAIRVFDKAVDSLVKPVEKNEVVTACRRIFSAAQQSYMVALGNPSLVKGMELIFCPAITPEMIIKNLEELEKELLEKEEAHTLRAKFLLLLQEVKANVPRLDPKCISIFNNADRAAMYLILDHIVHTMNTIGDAYLGYNLIDWMINKDLLGEGELRLNFLQARIDARLLFSQHRYNLLAPEIKANYATCVAKAVAWRTASALDSSASNEGVRKELETLFGKCFKTEALPKSRLIALLTSEQVLAIKEADHRHLSVMETLEILNLDGFQLLCVDAMANFLRGLRFSHEAFLAHFAELEPKVAPSPGLASVLVGGSAYRKPLKVEEGTGVELPFARTSPPATTLVMVPRAPTGDAGAGTVGAEL